MATTIRQPRPITPQNTAPGPTTTTPPNNNASAQRALPQSTEERLAALRAAREKRKNELGGPQPNTSTPTPNLVPQTADSAKPAIGGARPTNGGLPLMTANSTPYPSNPTPLSASLSVGPTNAARSPSINGQTSSQIPLSQSGAGRNLPSRVSGVPSTLMTNMSRRPSQVVIDKEKKTDYWKDVEKTAASEGGKISGEDLNQVISRAMALGIVGDKKQRESFSAPQSHELLNTLKSSMEKRIVELNGGRQINFESLETNNSSLMDKILNLERALSTMETRKTQEEEEEKKRVQSKISELERSLKALEAAKTQQREQNRRTMKLEIANLKEMMAKVQKDKDDDALANENKALSAKMNRLEAALRLMNDERKKGTPEDKDTLLLKRKLALFEQKFQEMESEKKMREEQDQGNNLRDKLLLMEDKLAKIEKRKSTSMTLQMQQKMEQVEKQLSMLRNERGSNHSDATNAKIAQKMALLEKQLQTMATTVVTPSMIQDEETIALRDHIKKLEESLAQQEKRMDDQRNRLEEERKRNYEKRKVEEEEFRRQAQAKEEELIKRIAKMEATIKSGGGGGGGGALDPELIGRLRVLEERGTTNISPDLGAKFTDIERKLEETQRKLEEERKATAEFFAAAPKEGPELESWQKDMQIAWLMKANNDLLEKLNDTTSKIDSKIKEFANMKFTGGGGGGGAPVHKSGLSYADINAKLAEIQAKLFAPDIDERESEQLNIDYEKLITELESTPEYQKEQDEQKEKWKRENEAPNKEAFEKVYANLKAMPETKLNAVFKRKPELKFILRTPDQLLKAHVNDFKQVSTQNLLLIEARALYHNMPGFRKDQEQQSQFVDQLRQKIESENSKPKASAPPPIEAKKKVVIKTKKPAGGGGGGGGSGGDFLEELLQKRKRKE